MTSRPALIKFLRAIAAQTPFSTHLKSAWRAAAEPRGRTGRSIRQDIRLTRRRQGPMRFRRLHRVIVLEKAIQAVDQGTRFDAPEGGVYTRAHTQRFGPNGPRIWAKLIHLKKFRRIDEKSLVGHSVCCDATRRAPHLFAKSEL